MTPNQTTILIESFHHCATVMGWNQGTRQITTFTNSAGRQVDIIKSYGQIDKATLKTECERFCMPGQTDAQTCPKQTNTMMSICLAKSFTAEALAKLLTYRNKYTFDEVECAPLMYKIIMRLATIASVATTQTLHNNLQSLRVYAATVNGNIDKLHNKVEKTTHSWLPGAQPLMTSLASYSRFTLWSPATTSSHTSSFNTKTSPTRPL
jgi:hypothetical protein